MIRFLMIVSAAAAFAGPAIAQDFLAPDDVLAASAEHFPDILESLANRRAVESGIEEARGAFDLVFESEGKQYASGFYNGREVGARIRQEVAPLGASIYGGYRVSDGTFPVYEDVRFTNTGGELKVGAVFSLLRDREIDERRFRINDARLALKEADLELTLTQVGVQHKALVAYWRWVAAGRQLAVYEDLLMIARDRQTGLEQQVRAGARARIFLTENLQNIARRQRLATEAEREFLAATNNLSFYYRGEDGSPVTPARTALPPLTLLTSPSGAEARSADFSALIAARPELRALGVALDRAERRVALNKNALLPSLEALAEVSTDFGDIAEGGASRDSTDTVVGLKFSVPLQRRDARGKLRRAEADLEALEQRRRRAEDLLEVDLRNILLDLDTSSALMEIAAQEVDQSETMQRAERERFASGASDFFLVNIREETAADARIRFYLAALAARVAQANYSAIALDFGRLGLDGGPALP
ncbi:MAG: TolC family protein [Parvularculaceae bacterium]|nr:TolC family protein [Parvularculaceae bacterium]